MGQVSGGKRIRNREQTTQAMNLRKAGATLQAIGDQLGGITRQRVHAIIKAGLQELQETCMESAEELRTMQHERINEIRLSLWKQRSNPRVADTLIRLEERAAKLWGLDAPAKSAFVNPDGSEAIPAVIEVVLVRPS